jgi:uracil phosphoribosyltransferase
MASVSGIGHPMIQHKLTIMRDKDTSIASFRRLLREIAHLMCYEVSRDLELEMIPIETPMAHMESPSIKGKKLVFASILRAGNGLLDGMLDLVPAARVAHIGIYRDHETLEPVEYYFKAPSNLEDRLIIVVDPMLATANSSIAAVDNLKRRGANNLRFLCLLAAPEASRSSPKRIPTSRSSPPPSTAISTKRATSCRGWATPATACTGRSSG